MELTTQQRYPLNQRNGQFDIQNSNIHPCPLTLLSEKLPFISLTDQSGTDTENFALVYKISTKQELSTSALYLHNNPATLSQEFRRTGYSKNYTTFRHNYSTKTYKTSFIHPSQEKLVCFKKFLNTGWVEPDLD